MNFRSLTRGDGVVIGAAVLLFIASFLDTFDGGGDEAPTAWDNGNLLMSMYLLGIIGAALIAVGRAMGPQGKVLGLDLGTVGIGLTFASAWSALGAIFDTGQSYDKFIELLNSRFGGGGSGSSDTPDAGTGLILGLIAALILVAAAVATNIVPALKAPLAGGGGATPPQPYGGQPQGGYGYPGAQGAPQPGQPYGGQPAAPAQPYGGQPQGGGQTPPPAQAQQAGAPAGDFSPFWFAVPVPRPLYAEDGSPTPIAELAPGTWYLAVEQRGQSLVAQTQDGRRGVLQDTTGIQRG